MVNMWLLKQLHTLVSVTKPQFSDESICTARTEKLFQQLLYSYHNYSMPRG